jgi:ribosomal protein S18 acetylase RimI-like enzyme
MPEIEIRQVVPDDIESLSMMEHGYHSKYVWQLKLDLSFDLMKTEIQRTRLPREVFVSYPRNREEIFNNLGAAEAFLVATLDDLPIGYIKMLAEKSGRIVNVTDLVVSASFRRQGVASGLLFAVMDYASNRNYSTLILEMQLKNDPAISMANKLGFKYCGFRDHYFSNEESALFFYRFLH